jgi:hypothetical protein
MQFDPMADQPERPTELMLKCVGIVTRHFQATALEEPLGSERGDGHVAARLDRVSDLPNACRSRGSILTWDPYAFEQQVP